MTDRGAGTLGAAVGLTVSFSLLVAAVLLAARLHHTTTVAALAADAAHEVARAGPDPHRAPHRLRVAQRLADVLGPSAEITWTLRTDTASVRVSVPTAPVVGLPGQVQRGADARWEQAP